MAREQVKTIRVSGKATASWLFRPFWQKSLDQIIEQHSRQGWSLQQTTPVNNWRGKTTHYMLTFKK